MKKKITIDELNETLASVHAEMKALQEAADTDDRDLSPEEAERFEAYKASFADKEKEIARRQDIQAMEAKLDAPGRRLTSPNDTEDMTPPARRGATNQTTERKVVYEGGDVTAAYRGSGGFRSFGEYAGKVHAASVGRRADQRLEILNAASTFGQEAVGADGGYAVPPDFKTTILEKMAMEDSLLGRTDQQQTSSNSITLPVDENEPWNLTGGTQGYWMAEGAQINQSKIALQNTTIRAEKLAALVPVTDELLADASSLEAYLRTKVPQKLDYRINDAIINGDGVGKPLGILKSNALVTQAAEGGQVAGTIVFNNVTKMWSRMPQRNRRNAIWIINQDAEPQLYSMVVPGTQEAFPAFLPAGGLSSSQYDSLMGRPVVYSEAAQGLGTPGDIILVDPTQYLSVIKSGGVRTDVSMHLYFDQDQTAFRFILRVGGQPWWSKPLARAKSTLPMSAYVALAQR